LLKNSVSRVPVQKQEEELPVQEATPATDKVVSQETTTTEQTTVVAGGESVQSSPVNQQTNLKEDTENSKELEERRIKHENYMRLISTPAPKPEVKNQEDVVPSSDDYATDKLIYNNKPETERDYKNLIGGIFNKAIKSSETSRPVYPQQEQVVSQQYIQPQPQQTLNFAVEKARVDGLKINTSETEKVRVRTANTTIYNLGETLFKCSVIVGIVLIFEFVLLLIFRNALNVSLGYPFVIFAIAILQLAIFGALAFIGYGKNFSKPTNNNYISISVILTIIVILIICVVAFLLNVNFNSSAEILSKMIIPCLTALAIPLFTLCYYFLIK
jgi:hypothetical protein